MDDATKSTLFGVAGSVAAVIPFALAFYNGYKRSRRWKKALRETLTDGPSSEPPKTVDLPALAAQRIRELEQSNALLMREAHEWKTAALKLKWASEGEREKVARARAETAAQAQAAAEEKRRAEALRSELDELHAQMRGARALPPPAKKGLIHGPAATLGRPDPSRDRSDRSGRHGASHVDRPKGLPLPGRREKDQD